MEVESLSSDIIEEQLDFADSSSEEEVSIRR